MIRRTRRMIRNVVCFCIALIIVATMPLSANAASDSGSITTLAACNDGLTVSWSASNNTFAPNVAGSNASANGTTGFIITSAAYDALFSDYDTTVKVTLTNTNSKTMNLEFAVSGTTPTITAGSGVVTNSSSSPYSYTMDNGETLTISLYNSSTTAKTTTVSDIKFYSNEDVSITFIPSANGSYSITTGGTAVSITDEAGHTYSYGTISAANVTSNSGYKFVGWMTSSNVFLGYTSSTNLFTKPSEDITVYAYFVPTDAPKYQVGTNYYYYWADAMAASVASSNATVLLVEGGTIPNRIECNKVDGTYVVNNGTADAPKLTYTIPSGVNFVVPYKSGDVGDFDGTPDAKGADSDSAVIGTRSAYLTLTVPDNTTINCAGSINVNAQQFATSNYNPGGVLGQYGLIKLNGTNAKLNVTGNLYCYGYITGTGTVNVQSGGKLYELLQIMDWRGGNASSSAINNDVFPFSQYYVQNVECPLVINSGATSYVCAALEAGLVSKDVYQTNAAYIGSGGFFQLGSGAVFSRSYNSSADRMTYTLSGGNVTASGMDISLSGYSMNTASYIFALNSNMSVVVSEGATFVAAEDYKILPNLSFTVNGTMEVQGDLYIYDYADWVSGGFVNRTGANNVSISTVGYIATTGKASTRTLSATSASMTVNGTLNVTGGLYTTSGNSSADKVLKGTGTVTYNPTTTAANLLEAENVQGIVWSVETTEIPVSTVIGNLAGVGTLKSFSSGEYTGLGADLNNYWYQHTVTLAEGTTQTITPTTDSVWDGSTGYIVTGGAFKFTIQNATGEECVTATNATVSCTDGTYTVTGDSDGGNVVITIAEHAYDEGSVTRQPTCTDKGVKTVTCGTCGHTSTEEVKELGHDFTEKSESVCTVANAGNCQTYKTYYVDCSRCDQDGTETWSGTTYGDHVQATSYSSDGTNHWYECTVCGEDLNKAECSGGTATCVAKKVCTTCNKEYGETDTTNGHNFSPDWTTDGTNHWKVCQNGCEVKGYEGKHEGGTANCQDQAVCSTCQTPYGETDSTTHKSVKTDAAVAATCEAAGLTEGKHCESCGTVITAQEKIPALGHEEGAAATCTTAQTCTRCSHVFTEALGHSYTNYVSKNDAKCEVDGTKTAKCDRCDETSTIPDEGSKLGHSYTQYVSNNNATCQTNATETASCDNGCGGKDTRPIADSMVDHSYGEYFSDGNAACLKDGTKTAKCIWCENTDTVTDTGSALRHSFTNYVSDGNATCMTDGTKTAKCDNNCGETSTITDAGSALGHSFTNYVPDRNETCADEGTETAKCDRCDAADTRDATGVQLKPHTFTNYVYNNDATCFADGTKTAHCDVCNTATDEIIAEGTQLTHSYSNYVSNKDATCTQDGTKSALCDHNCGTKDTIADTGSMLGHSFTKFESNGDASCTANGTETAKCDRCEEKMTQEDADSILPHSFTQYESNNDATCTADGTETAKCDNCDATHTRTQAGSMKDHEMGQWVEVTPAGCTTKGVEHRDCENCDYFETKETDALGHNMGDWATSREPSCTLDGEERRDCDRCDYHETKVLKSNGHDYHSEVTLEPTCVAKGTETYTCSKCQDTYTKELAETGVHTEATREENRVEATCGADGSYVLVTYCSVCDAVIQEEQKTIPATGAHTYEPSVTKEPTCIAVGEKTYTCSGCDASYTEEMAMVDHKVSDSYTTEDGKHFQACLTEGCSYKENEAVCSDAEGDGDHNCDVCDAADVSDHTESEAVKEGYVDATCTSSGYYDSVVYCGECSDELSRTSHTVSQYSHGFGDWEIITNATCTTDGSQKRACTVCGHEETGSIPATGHEVYNNGFCAVCDAYQPAVQNANGIYEIGNAGQLYWFAAVVNSGYGDVAQNTSANAELTADIHINEGGVADCNGIKEANWRDWSPIGRFQPYIGTFNGAGFSISGLYENLENEEYKDTAGFFGMISGSAVIKNVHLEDIYISAQKYVGGLAGQTSAGAKITNSTVNGYIGGVQSIGGLVGLNTQNSRIENSAMLGGTVYSQNGSVGGLVGNNIDCTISNCYNAASVVSGGSCGGLVGVMQSGTVSVCCNYGTLTSETDQADAIAGKVTNGNFNTRVYYLNNTSTSVKAAKAMTAAQLASGEVAYLLNGGSAEGVWKQTIGTDAYPTFAGATVYKNQTGGCTDATFTYAYSNTQEGDVIKHSWVEATCTEPMTCSACGATDGEKLGHSFTNYVPNNDATCTADGTKTAKCDRCGTATDTVVNEGSMLNHSFLNYVSDNNATCTKNGTETAKCEGCEETDTREDVDSMLDHAFTVEQSRTPATCKEEGSITWKCVSCDATTVETLAIDPSNHVELKQIDAKAPSCTESGYEAYEYCTECDYTTRKEVAHLGHKPGAATEVNRVESSCSVAGSYESVVSCSVCGTEISRETVKLPLAEHSWEDATYDAPKMCGKCGATEGSKLQRPAVDMVAPETVVPSVPENAEIAKDAAEEAVDSLVSSANNVAQPVTGIESDGNVDSLGAAKQQIKDENENVIAGSSYETSLIITLNAVVVDQEGSNVVAKKVTFDVSPMLYAINELGIKVGETKITAFDEPITFHLPVDKNSTAAFARVWHMDTEDLGLHKIQTDADGNRFVEVKAKNFSQFSLILEEECTDHNFVDGKCTICGEKEPRTLINLSGTAMTLGNSLSLDFGINIALLENNGEGHYAIITRHYADGTQDDVVRVDRADWQPYNGTVLTASYKKLAAKEMCDVLEVVVYNAAGEVISNTYTDSIRNYAIRQLNNSYNQSNTELLTVLVDMLNYGAAAQQFFRYNESNLANMDLNDVQKAYATDDFQAQDSRIKGNGYAGTALTLKNEILLDFVFFDSVIGTNYDGMYAIATYTNHYGEKKTVRMEEFKHYGAGYHYVSVNGMSVADCRQLVTCTVYNSNGEVIASATDSAEGYIARQIANGQTAEIYTSIMKFTISSYNYFH